MKITRDTRALETLKYYKYRPTRKLSSKLSTTSVEIIVNIGVPEDLESTQERNIKNQRHAPKIEYLEQVFDKLEHTRIRRNTRTV